MMISRPRYRSICLRSAFAEFEEEVEGLEAKVPVDRSHVGSESYSFRVGGDGNENETKAVPNFSIRWDSELGYTWTIRFLGLCC